MARAPYQVLVIPFFREGDGTIKFVLFRRWDRPFEMWQPITGGGEDGETTLETAVRETSEECGHTCAPEKFIPLESRAMIPANEFPSANWPDHIKEIPEYPFGVELDSMEIKLSEEHTAYVWLDIEKARARVYWPSNAQALLELYERLTAD